MVDIKFTDGSIGEFDKKQINSTKVVKVKKISSKINWSKMK